MKGDWKSCWKKPVEERKGICVRCKKRKRNDMLCGECEVECRKSLEKAAEQRGYERGKAELPPIIIDEISKERLAEAEVRGYERCEKEASENRMKPVIDAIPIVAVATMAAMIDAPKRRKTFIFKAMQKEIAKAEQRGIEKGKALMTAEDYDWDGDAIYQAGRKQGRQEGIDAVEKELKERVDIWDDWAFHDCGEISPDQVKEAISAARKVKK